MTTKDIEAREKAATPLTEFEIEEWRRLLDVLMHDAELATTIRWKQELRALATIDALLAQLKGRDKKLEAMQNGLCKLLDGDVSGFKGEIRHLLRILKGGVV